VPWRRLRYSYLDLPFGAGNGPAHSSIIDTLVSGAEVDGGYGGRFEDALDKNVIWSCLTKLASITLPALSTMFVVGFSVLKMDVRSLKGPSTWVKADRSRYRAFIQHKLARKRGLRCVPLTMAQNNVKTCTATSQFQKCLGTRWPHRRRKV
jgi:hypothetical protein